jgi:hypothetical protein
MSFPASPVNGQQATINGTVYQYNSTYGTWTAQTGTTSLSSSNIVVGGTATAANFTANAGGQFTGYITGAIGANTANTGVFTTVTAANLLSATGVYYSGNNTNILSTIYNPTISNYTEATQVNNIGVSYTINLNSGTLFVLTLTNNTTITMPATTAGKSFVIILNSGTGGYGVTWANVRWSGGSAPTLTGTANKADIFSFFSDGTSWYGNVIGQNY